MIDLTEDYRPKKAAPSEAAQFSAQLPTRGQMLSAKLRKVWRKGLLVVLVLAGTGFVLCKPYTVGKVVGTWYQQLTTGYRYAVTPN